MERDYRSGDALFAFGDDCRVCEWNQQAEELTGIPAEEVLGRRCWEVFAGTDESGGVICHPGCSRRRLLETGWPVRAQRMVIRTATGRRGVTVSSVALRCVDPPIYLHVFRNGEPVPADRPGELPRLTPRQLEVLELLHTGRAVKTIAVELRISPVTVRNHIQAILLELGCHSQLEALAKARRLGLVSSA